MVVTGLASDYKNCLAYNNDKAQIASDQHWQKICHLREQLLVRSVTLHVAEHYSEGIRYNLLFVHQPLTQTWILSPQQASERLLAAEAALAPQPEALGLRYLNRLRHPTQVFRVVKRCEGVRAWSLGGRVENFSE